MQLIRLGLKSLWSRRFTVALILLTTSISSALLLGVERVRQSTYTSFTNTISGVDLLVGARSGAIPLLLYTVFRVGTATNNITWKSYQDFASRPGVKWTIPMSLGDSHRGYRVLGTNLDYFEHYRVGRKRQLSFFDGEAFNDLFDVVIGAEVADALAYRVGDSVIISHGLGNTSFSDHDDLPFRISGILSRTGTPVDRTVHVSLEAIDAIHVGWEQGVKLPGARSSADRLRNNIKPPKAITAFMIGLESRIGVFKLQRSINEYHEEPLLAILPGVALQELWGFMSVAERALWIVSLFVVLAGFVGLIAVSLAGLNERRKEIAVLRAVGAGGHHISGLLVIEAAILTAVGILVGVLALYFGLWLLQPLLENRFGLYVATGWPSSTELKLMMGLLGAGVVCGIIPAIIAYRNSLVDGLTAKV